MDLDPYIGEIRLVAFAVIPRGWLPCDGRSLLIHGNAVLYSLLGNLYGGDGASTFALPDLRGRAPLHASTATEVGKASGSEAVVLAPEQLPRHTHAWKVSSQRATEPGVSGNWFAAPPPLPSGGDPVLLYGVPQGGDTVGVGEKCLQPTGAGVGHSNMQPYLALHYIIATDGIFPPHP